MSMATSSTAPLVHVTYLAWPGGTSAKCTPRSVPRRETEALTCATDSGCPTAAAKPAPWKLSAKAPRSSRHTVGVNTHALSTAIGSMVRSLHRMRKRFAKGAGSSSDEAENQLVAPADVAALI